MLPEGATAPCDIGCTCRRFQFLKRVHMKLDTWSPTVKMGSGVSHVVFLNLKDISTHIESNELSPYRHLFNVHLNVHQSLHDADVFMKRNTCLEGWNKIVILSTDISGNNFFG